ncbi:MAG TPA: inositol monophosphatase [Candidatus Limnocylindria bacterium]|nr:inositol monophosphatase [Candidatus Limnocylindria bacterium]
MSNQVIHYKDFAISLAKRAGEEIRKNFVLGMDREIKKDGSPVTKTDLAINKMVVEEVQKNFPGHAVIGEEESHSITDAEYSWVCDPVDGTIPFSHGMPTCAFSLALTRNGKPILGVAYDAFMDRMVVAEEGKGAFLNGEKIQVSTHKNLEGAYISHCIWRHMQYSLLGFYDDMVFNSKAENFAVGSIVYNAILLAAGQIDGIVFAHHTAHDVAAIKIIVEEAGGKVTDFWGNDQRYDQPVKGCLISNGLIHEELLKLVQKHLKVV